MRLPDFVPPMLAKVGAPFTSDEYLYEIKWDGIRAMTYAESGGYRLLTRYATRVEDRYPELAALADLPEGTILDGELVAWRDGRPDFQAVLSREQARSPARVRQAAAELPASYVVFDLVYERFEPTQLRLMERRARLRELVVALGSERIVCSEGVAGGGEAYVDEAMRADLEGVVAKRMDSRYLPGQRTGAWIKMKRSRELVCVIIGYLPAGATDIKSLVVAAEVGGALRAVGKVGSGLDLATRSALHADLTRRVAAHPVVPSRETDAVWVEPDLYCRVSYLEMTRGGDLRAPVFVGLVR